MPSSLPPDRDPPPPSPRDELEARISALILGEAGDFEVETLRARLAAEPDLAALHRRLEAAASTLKTTLHHRAAGPVADPTPIPGTPQRLSPERRAAIEKLFAPQPVPVTLPGVSFDTPARSWKISRRLVVQILAVAACVALGGFFVTANLSSTASLPRRQVVEGIVGTPGFRSQHVEPMSSVSNVASTSNVAKLPAVKLGNVVPLTPQLPQVDAIVVSPANPVAVDDLSAAPAATPLPRQLSAAELANAMSGTNQEELDKLLIQGRAQYLYGDYQGAMSTFSDAATKAPGNVEAEAYQLRISRLLSEAAYANNSDTRAELLTQVDKEWQRPAVFANKNPGAPAAAGIPSLPNGISVGSGGGAPNLGAMALAAKDENWNGNFTFTGTRDLNLGNGALTLDGDRSRIIASNQNAQNWNADFTYQGGRGSTSFSALTNITVGGPGGSGENTSSGTLATTNDHAMGNVAGGNVPFGSVNAFGTNSTMVLNGGSLQYTGTGVATNRIFTIGSGGAALDSVGAGAIAANAVNNVSGLDNRTITAPVALGINGTDWSTTGTAGFEPVVVNLGGNIAYTRSTLDSGNTLTVATGGILQGNQLTPAQVAQQNFDNTSGRVVTMTANTLTVGGAIGGSGANIVNNGTLAFNNSGTTVFSGNINGGGSFIKAGEGTLQLGNSTANGAVGQVLLDRGDLAFGAGGRGGARGQGAGGGATITAGTPTEYGMAQAAGQTYAGVVSGTGNLSGALTLNSNLTGAAGVTKTGAGTLVLSGTNTYTGNTTVNAGTLQLGFGTANGGTHDVNFVTGTVPPAGSTVDTNGNNGVLNNPIGGSGTGSGSLTKAGVGTLTLGGTGTYSGVTTNGGNLTLANANTYTGNTTISAGTLQLGRGSALAAQARENAAFGGYAYPLESQADKAKAMMEAADSASLVKTGTGVWTLSGNGTFAGGTTLNGGNLNISDARALGTGNVTINGGNLDNVSGGALAGSSPQTVNTLRFAGAANAAGDARFPSVTATNSLEIVNAPADADQPVYFNSLQNYTVAQAQQPGQGQGQGQGQAQGGGSTFQMPEFITPDRAIPRGTDAVANNVVVGGGVVDLSLSSLPPASPPPPGSAPEQMKFQSLAPGIGVPPSPPQLPSLAATPMTPPAAAPPPPPAPTLVTSAFDSSAPGSRGGRGGAGGGGAAGFGGAAAPGGAPRGAGGGTGARGAAGGAAGGRGGRGGAGGGGGAVAGGAGGGGRGAGGAAPASPMKPVVQPASNANTDPNARVIGGNLMAGDGKVTNAALTPAETGLADANSPFVPDGFQEPTVPAGTVVRAVPPRTGAPTSPLTAAPPPVGGGRRGAPAPTPSVVANARALAPAPGAATAAPVSTNALGTLMPGVSAASPAVPQDITQRIDTAKTSADSTAHAPGDIPMVGRLFQPQQIPNPPDQVVVRPASAVKFPAPVLASADPFSTFALNVNDASYRLALASLAHHEWPDPANVRTEEFLNAFHYHDPAPGRGQPCALNYDLAESPFEAGNDLLRVSFQTAASGRDRATPLRLTILLDNSGSMTRADREAILAAALNALGGQLRAGDQVSLVTFASTPAVRAQAVPAARFGEIFQLATTQVPDGGTNLEEALRTAYATARQTFDPAAQNRVVLLTDGAANLGDISPETLGEYVETQRRGGIALDAYGVGWDGFDDTTLEALTRHGDGRYAFLNSPDDVNGAFARQLAGALAPAALDVKLQIEFNPQRVTSYRLMGYNNLRLTAQQFRDNTVDAGELAAAEQGTALYSLVLNNNGVGPIGTARARFRDPATGQVRELAWTLQYSSPPPFDLAKPSLRLAAVAAYYAEYLQRSPFAGDVTPRRLLEAFRGVPEAFAPDQRPVELRNALQATATLSGN